jgi:hypothetical protein
MNTETCPVIHKVTDHAIENINNNVCPITGTKK